MLTEKFCPESHALMQAAEQIAREVVEPLVFLQDVPGFLVGRQVEEDQLLTEAIRWMQVLCEATVPKITVAV